MLHEHRRRVAVEPASADARAALGEALLQNGQTREATEQLERALELDPLHREARRLLVRLLVAEKRHVRASQVLVTVLRKAPRDPIVRDDIAEVFFLEGRTDDGLFQLVIADSIEPAAARTKKIVELCLARGYPQRAASTLERYSAGKGEETWSRQARAEIAAATGHAAPIMSSPIALGEAFLWGRLRSRLARLSLDTRSAELGALFAQLKRDEPAQVKRALVLLPEAIRVSPFVGWVKATIAACAGDLETADRLLSTVIGGPDPIVADLAIADRADVRFARGQLKDAAKDYEAATKHAPEDADLAEVHGDVLTKLDSTKAARAAYERAAKLAPGGTAAQKLALLRVRAVQRDAARPFGAMNALGWHAYGGAVTPVQAAWVAGDGELVLTGRVKRTGEEQAKVVHSLLKKRAGKEEAVDLHLHYEDTENEKDGPSAGLALALAAISASRKTPLRERLAATGELTLSGTVRAIGGLHEKLTAAYLHGITRVLVPLKNLQAIEELAPDLRAVLEIIPVNVLDEALAFAFDDSPEASSLESRGS